MSEGPGGDRGCPGKDMVEAVAGCPVRVVLEGVRYASREELEAARETAVQEPRFMAQNDQ